VTRVLPSALVGGTEICPRLSVTQKDALITRRNRSFSFVIRTCQWWECSTVALSEPIDLLHWNHTSSNTIFAILIMTRTLHRAPPRFARIYKRDFRISWIRSRCEYGIPSDTTEIFTSTSERAEFMQPVVSPLPILISGALTYRDSGRAR
jgi:hypothetical protein